MMEELLVLEIHGTGVFNFGGRMMEYIFMGVALLFALLHIVYAEDRCKKLEERNLELLERLMEGKEK